MQCPFLKAANVKYCEASAYRKLLPKDATSPESELCSTHLWTTCPAALQRLDGAASPDHCPFLHEAHAEYCSAASVTKFIPATNDLLSRCNSDGHLYCELYLLHADPQGDRLPHHHGETVTGTPSVDGVPVPAHLHFAPNHMWLDVSTDGSCHIGIDAFAARVFGEVERVSFVPQRTRRSPTAVLRVNGVDIPMTFPEPHAATANVYLRTAPSKLTDDPYGAGWLFECAELPSIDRASHRELLDGDAALDWMRQELRRLDEFVHDRIACLDAEGLETMADGGSVEEGLAAHLDRDDLIALALDFFASPIHWRRSS